MRKFFLLILHGLNMLLLLYKFSFLHEIVFIGELDIHLLELFLKHPDLVLSKLLRFCVDERSMRIFNVLAFPFLVENLTLVDRANI